VTTTLRLLVVSRSEIFATSVVTQLRRSGLEVRWERFDDPDELRAELRLARSDIALVDDSLLDPLSEVWIEWMVKVDPSLPIVVIGDSGSDDRAAAVMHIGARDYLGRGGIERLALIARREVSYAASRRSQRRSDERRLQAEDRFRSLVEQIPAVTYIAAPAGADLVWVYVSPQIEALTGYDADAFASDPEVWLRCLHPSDQEWVLARRRRARQPAQSFLAEYRIVTRNGDLRWVRDEACWIEQGSDHPGLLRGFLFDITERRMAEETIAHMAYHDRVTGLPNLTALVERFKYSVGAVAESRAALLQINLNSFKRINNTLGHAVGDQVLQQVGRRLREVLPPAVFVCRIGGDEFAALVPECTPDEVDDAVESIEHTLERPILIGDLPIAVESTVGVAFHPADGDSAQVLLRAAGVAIETARSSGAGHATYERESDPYKPRSIRLLGGLRHAIKSGQLRVEYQPAIDLRTGEVASAEALVRWAHPELGMLTPDEFIPLAEQGGLIRSLTWWVLNDVLAQIHSWRQVGVDLVIAVNLSARNLHQIQLPSRVQELLATWDIPASSLELEVTESAILAEPLRAMQILERLSAADISLAVDDFGTGYTSFEYLRRPPFRKVKIDKSFVQRMMSAHADAAIVRGIIELGHNLGFEVVAEGVDTDEALVALRDLGCDFAQGYYVSRPLPAHELYDWVQERAAQRDAIRL